MSAAPPLAVEIEDVSIVFGNRPDRALPLMDQGADRASIQAQTGQVLGVHDCSLSVAQGETLVLMGLSGSGKSTLLRAVNALNPVVRGRVRVRGEDGMIDVTGADAATLRRVRTRHVAMVFQQFGLLPWRSVRENVGLGLELAGLGRAKRRERVDEKLELVGLADWGGHKVSELSGGMQQRVGLARAFATEAPILLLDEPFSALDPLIRTKMQDDLMEVQARLRRTMIFVSHDLDEAFKLGSRIAIMEGGRIVQVGAPHEIYRAPCNAYVAEFVEHMNPLGVLRVRDVMGPAEGMDAAQGEPVEADALIRDVMDRVAGAPGPLAVVTDGRRVGRLDKAALLTGLSAEARQAEG